VKKSKRERNGWRNYNGKIWNNREKKRQIGRGRVGRRITVI
jgi:hypothetical protein